MKKKIRLDHLLITLYPNLTRNQIQGFIMLNKVKVNDKVENKSGTQVLETDKIELTEDRPKYVCRAGWKLEKALDYFDIDVTDLVVMDAGLSTGGFTDCLLQRGAKKIFGIDVGYGQVHERIRQEPKVLVMERTNLRHVTDLGEKVDLITLDLSFISILKVLDAVKLILKPDGKLVTLIKPQFEAQKHEVGKGGIIRDPAIHKAVVEKVTSEIIAQGFKLQGITESPIQGTMGNKEFLAYFVNNCD